jgi:hypothetical protein
MKKQFNYLLAATLSAGLFFASCKKDNSVQNTTDDATEQKVQSEDQSTFSNETDAVNTDADAAFENANLGSYSSKPLHEALPVVCDHSTVVDTMSSPRTITITYTGSGCTGNRTRSGVVVISFDAGFRYGKAGAAYTVTYQNLKITRKDGKSITINGSKTNTNVTGGRLRNLATASIVHEITSNGMSVKFDNGTERTWKIAKRRTFTYDNGLVLAITGISTEGEGIAEWGTNRFGKTFTTTILEALTIKQSCNFRLVSGKVKHTVGAAKTITTTFGLDASGNPVATCPTGPFYFKAEWSGTDGTTKTFIAPY